MILCAPFERRGDWNFLLSKVPPSTFSSTYSLKTTKIIPISILDKKTSIKSVPKSTIEPSLHIFAIHWLLIFKIMITWPFFFQRLFLLRLPFHLYTLLREKNLLFKKNDLPLLWPTNGHLFHGCLRTICIFWKRGFVCLRRLTFLFL